MNITRQLGMLLVSVSAIGGEVPFSSWMGNPDALLLWDFSGTLRPTFGYSSNPTLAPDQFKQGAYFSHFGADALLFRIPTGDNSFNLVWSGDDTRYFGSSPVNTDQLFVTQANYAYKHNESWSLTLRGQHVFINQVIDLSSEDLGIGIGRAKGHTLMAQPGIKYQLDSHWWVEAQEYTSRQLYQSPLDDFWEYATQAIVGYRLANASSITASYTHTWRIFDDSPLLTPSRELLPGTNTRTQNDGVELRWRQNWDQAKVWSTTLRSFIVKSHDNGLGYYDYHRWGTSASLRWNNDPWKVELIGRYVPYFYDDQLIAPDEAVTRQREEWSWELQIQYAIRKHLSLTASYEYQYSSGNYGPDNFSAQTVQAGVEWSF